MTSQSNKIADLQTLLDVSEHQRHAMSAASEAVEKALQASLQEALRGSKSGGGGGGGTAGGMDTSALEREVAELRRQLEQELRRQLEQERAVAALTAKDVRERDAESIRDLRERITRMEASSRGNSSGGGGGGEGWSEAGGDSVARCTCTYTPTQACTYTPTHGLGPPCSC